MCEREPWGARIQPARVLFHERPFPLHHHRIIGFVEERVALVADRAREVLVALRRLCRRRTTRRALGRTQQQLCLHRRIDEGIHDGLVAIVEGVVARATATTVDGIPWRASGEEK